jgi:phage-related protein
MAGPSVMVRVMGDLKGLGDAFSSAGKTAQGAVSKIHGTFSSMLGALNQTGVLGPFGLALSGIDDAIGNIIEHGKKIGPALLAAGGALVGIGAGLQQVGSKDQAAHQQLQAAIEATGGSYEDYAGQVEGAIKGQEKYGTTADKTQDALRSLIQATHDPAKAFQLLGETADVAASKHEDLTTAADQVGKVYNGNTKLLKPYGIELDKTTGKTKDGETALQALADVTKGQASAATDTFAGKLDAVKAKVEDLTATIGQKYGPAIQGIGIAAMAAASVVEVASTIMAAGWFAAFWPIGVAVLALAGLGAAIYLLVTHFQDVIDWLKTHWPILVDIIFGPIGLAITMVIQHFGGIETAAKTVLGWFKTAWQAVYTYVIKPVGDAIAWVIRAFGGLISWFAGLPGQIGRIAAGMWHGISDAFSTAIMAVYRVWNGVWGWLTGIGGDIASIAGGMWNGILNAFRGMVNGIIDIWNGLHFTLPKVDAGPIHIGGETIRVPQIPHLAQGGLITGTGLIYAHAGEAITPAKDVGPRGPAVVVQNATFSTELDVDAFMRKAAWVARTQKI